MDNVLLRPARMVVCGFGIPKRVADKASVRHRGPAYTAEFSPDGKFIVSGGRDRRLLSWAVPAINDLESSTKLIQDRLQSPEQIFQDNSLNQLGEHAAAIRAVSFSPDGKTLYSASDDNTVGVWNIGQNFVDAKLVKSLRGHGGWVHSCVAAADGLHVLSGSYDGTVFLWDWTKYAFPRVLRPEAEQTIGEVRLTSTAASPDARWIATAAENGAVTMWDMADPLNPKSQLLREGHDWQATTAAYFSGGSRLLTSGGDNSTLIWDTRRGNQLLRMGGWNKVGGTGLARRRRRVAPGSVDCYRQRPSRGARKVLGRAIGPPRCLVANTACRCSNAEATAIAFTPNDEILFVGDQSGRGYLYNSESGELIKQFEGHDRKISAAAFLPNGHLLTSSSDRIVVKWNIQIGGTENPRREREYIHKGRVVAMDVSPDGTLLITAADSKEDEKVLRLWNVDTGEEIRHLANGSNGDSQKNRPIIRSVTFHPTQPRALVTIFDPTIVFDPNDKSKSPYQVGTWDWENDQAHFGRS